MGGFETCFGQFLGWHSPTGSRPWSSADVDNRNTRYASLFSPFRPPARLQICHQVDGTVGNLEFPSDMYLMAIYERKRELFGACCCSMKLFGIPGCGKPRDTTFTNGFGHLPGGAANISGCIDTRDICLLLFICNNITKFFIVHFDA